MNISKKSDWLVIVFIHEIDLAASEVDKLVREIEEAGFNENNQVYLLRDHRSVTTDGENTQVFFNLKLSLLQKDDTGRIAFQEQQITGFDSEKSNTWQRIFKFIFKTAGPSNRKMVLTWSHGGGFGINKEDAPVIHTTDNRQPAAVSFENQPARKGKLITLRNQELVSENDLTLLKANKTPEQIQKVTQTFNTSKRRNIINNTTICKNLEILWIWQLANVFNIYPINSKIDILLMMNCNMQLLDTGYLLRKKVKYLVGPESPMVWYGYAYKKLFSYLNNEPDIPINELLTRMKDDYIEKYKTEVRDGKEMLEETTFFANSLRLYYRLLRILEESLTILLPLLTPENFQRFVKVRREKVHSVSEEPEVNNYDLVDMGEWLKAIAEEFVEHGQLQVLLTGYHAIIGSVVKTRFIGQVYLDHDRNNIAQYGNTGVALFYPDEQPADDINNKWGNCAYFDDNSIIRSPFVFRTRWDSFLKQYYLLLGKPSS